MSLMALRSLGGYTAGMVIAFFTKWLVGNSPLGFFLMICLICILAIPVDYGLRMMADNRS